MGGTMPSLHFGVLADTCNLTFLRHEY